MSPALISCRVMVEELRPLLPEGAPIEILEMSLHTRPAKLREALQEAVNRFDGRHDPIYLGYGLCSRALVGLVAQQSRLVLPRTDDCIGIFLGSQEAYKQENASEPGTYFLTSGWIGSAGGSVFSDYDRMVTRYGAERADRLMAQLMGHYRRLLYISTPAATDAQGDLAYARAISERHGLELVVVEGTSALLDALVASDWDERFLTVAPGEAITLEAFLGMRLDVCDPDNVENLEEKHDDT